MFLATVLLVACSSSRSGHSSPTTQHQQGKPGAASASSTTALNHNLVATFADNGGTLNAIVGDQIRVVLAGTSWTQKSSDPAVLAATGSPSVLPASSGCVKDQGCGSVTVYYKVLKTGKASIEADRGNCSGASATCKTGPGAFKLNVVVTAS